MMRWRLQADRGVTWPCRSRPPDTTVADRHKQPCTQGCRKRSVDGTDATQPVVLGSIESDREESARQTGEHRPLSSISRKHLPVFRGPGRATTIGLHRLPNLSACAVQLWHDDDIRRSQTIGNRVAVATLLCCRVPLPGVPVGMQGRRDGSRPHYRARPLPVRRRGRGADGATVERENRFGASSKFDRRR
jgi:hypothetical protein